MWNKIKQFFAPPNVAGDEDRRRLAGLLNTILWTELGIVLAAAFLIPFTGVAAAVVPVLGLVLFVAVSLFLLRAGRVELAGSLFLANLWLAATAILFTSGGLAHQTPSSHFVVLLVAALLFDWRAVAVIAALDVILYVGVFVAEQAGVSIPAPLVASRVFDISILVSNLVIVAVFLSLTVRSLRDALTRARQSAADLRVQSENLQQLVDERSRELARRTGYLGAATAVAREAQAAGGDLTRLLPRIVDVISEQFGFYHTGLFLLDASKEWMVLQAASSEGGQHMLARGHRLQVGSQSIVGYVAARGERRVALDVGADAVFFDNPDLPETRSEMAVPLRVRGAILGALDVQSTAPQAFTDEDVAVLQALADQVAMAVNNAQLLKQVAESLESERRAYGEQVRGAWLQMLEARAELGFYDDGQAIVPAGDLWRPEMRAALNVGTVVEDKEAAALAMPIRIRDQVVGVLDGRKADGSQWSPEEIELLQTLIDQLSAALEGAQLYEDTQRRAVRERIIRQITEQMRRSADMEGILRTTLTQLGQTIDAPQVYVRLGTEALLRRKSGDEPAAAARNLAPERQRPNTTG